MAITIEHLKKEDHLEYRKIRLAFLHDDPTVSGNSYEEEAEKTDEEWLKEMNELIEHDQAIIWIAKDGDEIVGTAVSTRDKSPKLKHSVFIMRLFVRDTYRGQGIGKKLFSSLIQEIESDTSVVKIRLDVTSSLKSAIGLYKSLGFEQVGLLKKEYFVNGEYYDVIEMEKYL